MPHKGITEGQTAPVRYIMRREGGSTVDLSSTQKVRVTLTALGGQGDTKIYESTDGSGRVIIASPTNGEVLVKVDELKASESPYVIRFWLYWTTDEREPAPPDDSERLVVHPNYGG